MVSGSEGKHPWHLGQFPKRTEAAVVVHGYFTEAFDGLVYRLPLVASRASGCSNQRNGTPSQLDYRAAGRSRHGALALAPEAKKIVTRSSSFSRMPMAVSIWPNSPSLVAYASIVSPHTSAPPRPSFSAMVSAPNSSIKTSETLVQCFTHTSEECSSRITVETDNRTLQP